MNKIFDQIIRIVKGLPMARRVLMGVVLLAVLISFATMFYWANKVEYKPAYTGLNADDASQIVAQLKETRIPYRLENDGATIAVPEDSVYEVRLSMAGAGLPKGSGVGYEVFDETNFGTTEFVQQLNRQRALQGELARTIREFNEVVDAKVMIVLPKDSVFIEETRPPSVSVLLKLKEPLDEEKVNAVVYLVASSIEDMKPQQVTVVDTTGSVLFKGKTEAEKAEKLASKLAKTQLQYKAFVESNLTKQIQSMLERIVGANKAIVRVTSDMDFSSVDVSEEIYDPTERNTPFVRSRKSLSENKQLVAEDIGEVSSVNPIVPPGEDDPNNLLEKVQKANDTVNYELSKTTRKTTKPIAVLKRLSVAAVIDGKYTMENNDAGKPVRTYVPRTEAEMEQFRSIVSKAMGYNEEREDQVSVESFPFSSLEEFAAEDVSAFDLKRIQKEYGRILANFLLVILLFVLIVRPVIKVVQDINKKELEAAAAAARLEKEAKALLDEERRAEVAFEDMSSAEKAAFISGLPDYERAAYLDQMSSAEKLSYLEEMSLVEKAMFYSNEDVAKTANIIKGWLSEG